MDVGNPSNFERMLWLYGGDVDAMRHDIAGSRHTDDEVRETIKRVYETRGYLLDPHSAIAYLGLSDQGGRGHGPEAGRHLSRNRAPGEVPRDRRADHRQADRDAARWPRRLPGRATSCGSTPSLDAVDGTALECLTSGPFRYRADVIDRACGGTASIRRPTRRRSWCAISCATFIGTRSAGCASGCLRQEFPK